MLQALEGLVMSSELLDELVGVLDTSDFKDLLDSPLILVESPCNILFLFLPGGKWLRDLELFNLRDIKLLFYYAVLWFRDRRYATDTVVRW